MHAWVMARLAEGRTVSMTTRLRVTQIKPKHADLVRLRNGHCQVLHGKKGWLIMDGCRVSAD